MDAILHWYDIVILVEISVRHKSVKPNDLCKSLMGSAILDITATRERV